LLLSLAHFLFLRIQEQRKKPRQSLCDLSWAYLPENARKDKGMKNKLSLSLLLLSLFFMNSCGPPLQDYEPKNAQEKEIKNVLVEFAKARNDYNVQKIVTLLSDDCNLNFYTRILSKSEFASLFKDSDLESFGKYEFVNPEFNIKSDFVEVKMRWKQGILPGGVFEFKMIRQNNRWMISEWNASRG
jgi:hypothetical protein